MNNREFDAWCASATEKIRYGPDRDMVSKELRDHLEDRYDALIAAGSTPEEATAKALEAMGSAREIAPQLGAIHRPWLGYLCSAVKAVTIGVAVCFCFSMTSAVVSYNLADYQESINDHRYEENVTMVYDSEEHLEVEGYQIRIDDVAVSEWDDRLYFRLWVRWFPGSPRFNACNHFWAVDSLGNIYASIDNRSQTYDRSTGRWVQSGGGSSGSSYREFRLSLSEFDCAAQWVEIHYDRDGRDIILRIDLTGGEPVG